MVISRYVKPFNLKALTAVLIPVSKRVMPTQKILKSKAAQKVQKIRRWLWFVFNRKKPLITLLLFAETEQTSHHAFTQPCSGNRAE